ncbi:hypothetical protein GCM10022393_30940 [Aquimarina addita]|uniref:DUF4397 domain-containing protein n=2 Tax=Aquimarina addita TaxID=870485 RepID=A0ABP6UR71_9FLAO
MARVQVIHNSADAAAASVDVYLNEVLLLDDFNFRTASPFVDAPAGVPLHIEVFPSNSMDSSGTPVYELTETLADGETYVLVADGIVSSTGYSPAPAFGLQIYDMGSETAAVAGNTDVLVHHGSTDAPTVDVNVQGGGATLVDDISYTEFAGYLPLLTDDYAINVSTSDGTTIVKAYDAPLATLGLEDVALTVVASGFLDPSVNSDGEAFGLFVALPAGGDLIPLPESTARVQVIHNSADAAAASVDVYLNESLLLDDFNFRTASSFIDAPAGVPLNIEVFPSDSMDSSGTPVYSVTPTLTADATYVLVADGIVSSTGYSPAPAFGLQIYDMGLETAAVAGNTDVLVHHGSTDAPTVDVNVQGGGATLVDDISYTEFAGYLPLLTDDYAINVSTSDGTTIVKAYDAPLATLGLEDVALTVVASGFLDPSVNSDGEAFGLFVALPAGGDLIPLPESTARVQVIHNSADAAAASVDVYLNESLLLNDFNFRTASPFIDAPAGVPLNIEVFPSDSMDSSGTPVYSVTPTLTADATYVLVADGIVSSTGYSPAPAFGLQIYDMARETAATAGNTDILVHHGATDAPTVDVNVQGGSILVDDISYTEFSDYLELATDDYFINVSTADGATIVQGYDAPLATLGLEDVALTVVASGFLDPSANSNGEAFGLFVVLPAGGDLIPLPSNTLDIREFANVDALVVYPNPSVAGDLFVRLPQITTDIDATIYDMTGRAVLRASLSEELTKLDVSTLEKGMYMMNLNKGKDSFGTMISVQ